MADDLNIQAGVTVNAEQAEAAFDRLGNKAAQMANEVAASANKAGQAVDKVGDGAGASAEKFTRAEARMRDSIKRSTQELQLLGKTASEKLEFNIQAKGLDAAKFAPLLAQLKQVEEQSLRAQQAATGSLDKMGMSAKATAAAMRGVPAQFQDIIVSLQGGQAPMTVLLQQGSQLSGMFGGAGNAAKALGGYIMGLINPFTLAAAAVAGLGVAMASINGKDAALLALSTQLTGTGRASAAAVGDIKALIKELDMIPGVSKASATAIITEFAKVNGIGSDLFKSLGSSVADFAAATGTDLPTAAKKLADAFADPAKGAQALEGALGTLTAAQILTIEKMAAMGDKSGAQVAMMEALKQATEGLAQQGMTPLGDATDKMSNAWDKLTTSIGNSEAFRTANSWLATLIEKVAELTVRLSQMKPPTWLQYLPVVGPAIGALTMAAGSGAGGRSSSGVVGEWNEGGATGSWGPTASETEQQVKAAIAATRGYETQAAAMDKLRGVATQAKAALKELEGQNRGGSVEAVRLRDSIAAVNEKLADMGKKGGPKGPAKETISEYDKLIKKLSDELPKAAAEAEAAQMGYNKAQTEFLALAGSPAWASFTNSQRAVVASMFEGKIASEEAGEAAKALSKSYAEAAAERIKTIQSMERAADSLQSQNDALREEIELIGLSTEQQTVVLQQRNDVIILTKEATLAELERQSAITGTQTRVEIALASEIAALKERNALLGAKGVKNAAVDAAKSAADEWQKTTDSINQSLTDSLLRGFESGKDFAKNMRDTVVNMFKTMVLRPVISAIVNPIAGAVTGALGLSGAANAATGGSNLLGTALQGTSLYNGLTSGTGVLGSIGNAIGLGVGASTTMGGLGATAIGSYAAPSVAAMTIAPGATAAGAGGMSGALAAIPGWGWALAGVALLGSLAKKFDDSGTPHIGAGAVYSEAGGLQQGAGIYNKQTFGMGIAEEYAKGTQEGVSTIAKSLTQTFDGIAKAFGKTAGYEIATAFADDSSKDGAWGSLRISKDGADLLNWNDTRESKWAPREFANGEEGYKEYLAEIAKDTRAVLLDMDLPSWADTMLESIGDAANMDQLAATVQQIGVIQTTFVQLGKTMEGFAGLTDQAFEALMRASGGFESLAANAGTYYENFYSEAEKTAAVTRSVSEALAQVGVAMPATRDEFRALVESQLALGESGAEAVAALLGVSGAFASVVPAASNATASLQAQAEAMEGLQIKLLRAQGNELAAVAIERQKELAALQAFGPAAVAMQQQIYGIMDAMSALESGAAAYFAGVDRQQAAEDYTDQGSDALSKFFGTAADASASAAASAAQASADAASTAAASWRSAAQSIQAAIDGLRAGTTDAMDPAARYALTKATLDAYTVSALGGDADAASKLAGAADDFLRASESGSTTQAQYLRDRVLAEAKLASVMESSEAQASVQDTIAASAGAAVTQLEAMNANLTGFASTLYELLSTQYQGVDKETAGGVATSLANMRADWDAYFKARDGWAAVGSTYTDASFGGASFTKLSNNMAAFTGADGAVSYLRESESLLDVAKRIPELRALWEKQYGLKLPAYAVGTNYVGRTGPALLHEGEAVIPKAFNPWAGGGQGNGEMLAELRALRQTNERLEARLASIEESNRDMATLLDNVTEGGNAMRSEVMA